MFVGFAFVQHLAQNGLSLVLRKTFFVCVERAKVVDDKVGSGTLFAQAVGVMHFATDRADVVQSVGAATGVAAICDLRVLRNLVIGDVDFFVVIADDVEGVHVRHAAFVPFQLRNVDVQMKVQKRVFVEYVALDFYLSERDELACAGVAVFSFAQVDVLFCPLHHHGVDEVVAAVDAFDH